jgi:NAD(P)-dependent dehydrogenase (short-subunit alcohol dehydrogenase family)
MTEPKKTVLITGGTDGLGKAAGLLFARRGYRVFAAGRSAKKREELERVALAERLALHTLEMNVSDDDSVRTAVELVLAQSGAIDVLINNAGVGYLAVVEELRMSDFRQQFETNVFGVLRVTQAVLPHMRQRRRGRVVMMSSVAGLVSPPTYGAYSSSKHAVEGLANALRLEMYPFGVEVILIEPGYITTNFEATVKELMEPYAEQAQAGPYAQIYSGVSAGARRGRHPSRTTPEDCARVICKAVEALRPKARYAVTPLAKWVVFGKRILTDARLDSFLRKKYGISREG